MTPQKIFLTGMPGSGKTTLGQLLSEKLELKFIDLDDIIEEKTTMAISEIFKNFGEKHFRELESKYLNDIAENIEGFVMATGGGTVCFYDNIEFINRKGTSIYLNVSPRELYNRLHTDILHRPLLKGLSEKESLLNEIKGKLENREPYYQQSHIIITDDDITIDQLLHALKEKS